MEENFDVEAHGEKAFRFYREVLKSPQYVVAPMVDASELGFRMLCRKYGAQLCYTPMFHSMQFAKQKKYRKKHFQSCPEDRPLIVQFSGNDPEILLEAAKHVEKDCDAVDINLGCPQRIAKRGNYGAFLMDSPDIVKAIVEKLHNNLKIPVFCKMRIFPEKQKTIEFALMLQNAGCSLLTIHGRTKEMKGKFPGKADLDIISDIKKLLRIPVIANGNVREFSDISQNLKIAGVDGIMSAEGILRNPALFSGENISKFRVCFEVIDYGQKYDSPILWVKNHLVWILIHHVYEHPLLRDQLLSATNWDILRESIVQFEDYVTNGKKSEPIPPKIKLIKDSVDIFDGGIFED
eukprot:TRINITY_DN3728_c0_g1_i1.p1 TRINITY_DN3728_c0_g1~~TRINITY_DN3728_c0_g1_i1.p1  ORF type:complete len:388 (-),score=86.70 TRINITY_DN3728_c0_g1_i1:90-1136(-)